MNNAGFTELLLGLLAILLVVAAVIDVRTFTISNSLNLAVALLAPLYWLSIALPLWPDAAIQLGRRRRRLRCCSPGLFTPALMGGGDVKLAAALALWFSPASTLKFLVLMSIAGGRRDIGRDRAAPAAQKNRPTRDSLWRCNRFWRFGHSNPTVS